MKVHIPVCVAIAVALISSAAYGQQPQRQVYAQQNWRAPVVQAKTMQEPALQVQSNAAPAPVAQGAYNSVVSGGCDGCGTNDCGGRCGGRLRNRGTYDPCNPIKYVSLFGGAATLNDIGFDQTFSDPTGAVTGSESTILNQNNGWTIGAAVGRSLGRRLRGEFEVSYRNASINTAEYVLNGASQSITDLDGQVNGYRSMTNVLFDFNPCGRFNVYAGGGMGVSFVDLDSTDPAIPSTARIKTSTWAYQAIIGMSAKIKPRTELFLDYRYSGSDHIEIDTTSPAGASNFNLDITSNDIFVGLRMRR